MLSIDRRKIKIASDISLVLFVSSHKMHGPMNIRFTEKAFKIKLFERAISENSKNWWQYSRYAIRRTDQIYRVIRNDSTNRTAIETNTADMLQTVWNELDYRVDVCRITKGAHIEHL